MNWWAILGYSSHACGKISCCDDVIYTECHGLWLGLPTVPYFPGHPVFRGLGGRKGIRSVKTRSVGVLAWLSGARCRLAYGPADATATCFSKIQIGFTFLALAHPSSAGQRAVKWVCVCVAALTCWHRWRPPSFFSCVTHNKTIEIHNSWHKNYSAIS